MLKQRYIFQLNKMIKTIDSLAVIQGQKIVEPTVGFSRKRND